MGMFSLIPDFLGKGNHTSGTSEFLEGLREVQRGERGLPDDIIPVLDGTPAAFFL